MLRLAKSAFLLLVFSLAFMKPNIGVGGLLATVTDLLFLVAAGLLGLAIARGRATLRWNPFYAVLLIYFGAMAVSAIASQDPQRSWFKLATVTYLLCLPVLADNLIESGDELRNAVRTWLAACAVPALVGSLAVVLFAIGMDPSPLDFARHGFGTLPPGNYTRIEATFRHPAMLCSYLTVSLLMLMAARRVGWVHRGPFRLLLSAIMLTAVFTLTPGLGAVFLALGSWYYLSLRERAQRQAYASLAAGGVAALLFLGAAVLTPLIHPTAPYLIDLPGFDYQLAPSVRLMTWADATSTFLAHPLFGSGLGTDAASVHFIAPSGREHWLSDAHNVFLSVAAGSGVVGLAALILLVASVIRIMARARFDGAGVLTIALGLGWLVAFVYTGLTGSYEDARHLWVILGLLLASARQDAQKGPALAPPLQPS